MSVSAGASAAIFGLYGGLGGFLAANRSSLPLRLSTSLATSAAVFVGINLTTGVIANLPSLPGVAAPSPVTIDVAGHLGGLVGGFLAGYALALPLTPPPRAALVWTRAAAVAAVGFGVIGATAFALPVVDDYVAALTHAASVESQGRARYNDALHGFQTRAIRPERFADIIERELLPPLNAERQALEHLRLAGAPRAAALATADALGWRADAWRLAAAGLRTQNVQLVERAGLKDAMANRAMARIGTAATHPAMKSSIWPIVGVARNESGRALPGVVVQLACAEHASPAAVADVYWQVCDAPPVARTGMDGRFSFEPLPAGPYVATASLQGYRDQERDVDLDELSSVSFAMRPLVDEVTAATRRMADVEKQVTAVFNDALNRVRSRAISSSEFATIIETKILPPWNTAAAAVRDAQPTGQQESAQLSRLRTYVDLRSEAWRLMAQGARENNAALLEQASKKQAAAAAAMRAR